MLSQRPNARPADPSTMFSTHSSNSNNKQSVFTPHPYKPVQQGGFFRFANDLRLQSIVFITLIVLIFVWNFGLSSPQSSVVKPLPPAEKPDTSKSLQQVIAEQLAKASAPPLAGAVASNPNAPAAPIVARYLELADTASAHTGINKRVAFDTSHNLQHVQQFATTTIQPGQEVEFHVHPSMTEIYHIKRGLATFVEEDTQRKYIVQENDSIAIPMKVKHRVLNHGKEPLEMLYVSVVQE